MLALGMAQAAWGQGGSLELAIKATYLVKFVGFVEWPAGTFDASSAPINLCVVGAAFGALLDQAAAGQVIGQHPLAVRPVAAVTRNAGCQVLYAAGSSAQTAEAAIDAVRGAPVLTVTDLPATASGRGMINFTVQDNHVRFEIDDRQATANGLRISSQLLALAVNNRSR